MRVLRADRWDTITGRGRVAWFSRRIWSPPVRVGEQLMIDGALYTVSGIETALPLFEPSRHAAVGYSLALVISGHNRVQIT